MTSTSNNLPIKSIPQEIAERRSVFAVCFCFLFSIGPHFPNLPLWVIALVLLALGWRCLQNLGKLPEMPKWVLIPLVLLGGVGVFAEYWTIVGRDAGLSLLTVMAAFKFLESRYHRDLLILVFLCYFLIATHFLFSQSIPIAIMMFATLVVITTTLITINQRDDRVTLAERLGAASRLVLLSIPLMLILFVLVPRVPGPLWGLTSEQRGGITGLSDHMSPGKISNLIRSNDVAFRVSFEGQVPPQNRLYWRGPVLAQYDGFTWSQATRKQPQVLKLTVSEPSIDYTVTLEPHGEHWMLALDIPTKVIEDGILTADFQLTSKNKINDLTRYSMQSRLGYQVGKDEPSEYLATSLEFPEQLNPQTLAYGRSLAQQYQQPQEIVNDVLNMFRQQEFIYTLRPPPLGNNRVDSFLFGTRRGFCEHYAGSFALIMRAAGIPARVVTGYQGGEFNQIGNYLIVRQSDAHAWVEVWVENLGWIRVDPTAAVSPNRIEQGLDQALDDETANFRIQNRHPIFGNLLYRWDNLQHGWNDWVLNYDQHKQKQFLNKLNIGIENWSDMVFALVLLLVAVTGAFWIFVWWRELPPKPKAYERLFNRLLRKLARQGIHKSPAEDPRKFMQRVIRDGYAQHEQLQQIIDLYNRIKYGRLSATDEALNRLRSGIKSLS